MYPSEISPEYGSNVQSEAMAATTSMWLLRISSGFPTGFLAVSRATRLTLFSSGVGYSLVEMPSAERRSMSSWAVSTVRPSGCELSNLTYSERVWAASLLDGGPIDLGGERMRRLGGRASDHRDASRGTAAGPCPTSACASDRVRCLLDDSVQIPSPQPSPCWERAGVRALRGYPRAAARSVRSCTILVPSSRFSTESRSSRPWNPLRSSAVSIVGTRP